MKNKVIIIGGGVSGIVSAKYALAAGIEPIILEKTSAIGGLWSSGSEGGMWSSMKTNLSKNTCTFSDFPWDEIAEDFPNQKEVAEYLNKYVKHFNLHEFIRLNVLVTKVYEDQGNWKVEYIIDHEKFEEVANFIIVASGIFSAPDIPNIPGIETFKDNILHSSLYKTPGQLSGKKVLVVGNSFSGTEIATELAFNGAKVTHLINRPYWVIPRYLKHTCQNGEEEFLPLDLVFYQRASRYNTPTSNIDELNINKHKYFSTLSNQSIINKLLEIAPQPTPPFVAISDGYLKAIEDHSINIRKAEIASIDYNKVNFSGQEPEEFDNIIFCTGYKCGIPFLDEATLSKLNFNREEKLQPLLLYKCTFSPYIQNIAFIGMYRGPFFAVMELQAMWAAKVFSNQVDLPSQEAMKEGVNEERIIRESVPRPQFPHGDYIGLADGIAKEIEILPDFSQLSKEKPNLYKTIWEGPFLPSHYKLFELFKGQDNDINSNDYSINERISYVNNILRGRLLEDSNLSRH